MTWINTFLSHLSHFTSSVFWHLKAHISGPVQTRQANPSHITKPSCFVTDCQSYTHTVEAGPLRINQCNKRAWRDSRDPARLAVKGVCFHRRHLESCTGHVNRAAADLMTFLVALMSVIAGFESEDWRVKKDEELRVNWPCVNSTGLERPLGWNPNGRFK